MTISQAKPINPRLTTLAALGIAYPIAALTAALCAGAMFSGTAHAAEANYAPAAQEAAMQVKSSAPAAFQKKTYGLNGSITIEQRGSSTFIVFSDDFKTKRGPDLKVFLSRNDVASSTGTNAVPASIRIGELKSNQGAQEYELPAGVNIADFNSVLVHCEAFSKLWGGADLG